MTHLTQTQQTKTGLFDLIYINNYDDNDDKMTKWRRLTKWRKDKKCDDDDFTTPPKKWQIPSDPTP